MGRKFNGLTGGVAAAAAVVLMAAGCTKSPSPREVSSEVQTPSRDNLPADLKVVGVDAVAKDPKGHAGRVAVEGVVSKVFADRGAFNLIDPAEFAACGKTTCAEYTVPVLVPKDEFRGDLPKEKDTVIAVGEVRPTGKGYTFVIQEVRGAGGVLLARTKPAAGKAADGEACCDDEKCGPADAKKTEPGKKDATPKAEGCCDDGKCQPK